MSAGTIIIVTGIAVLFATFAAGLMWADFHSHGGNGSIKE